jgi:hypothetical protein
MQDLLEALADPAVKQRLIDETNAALEKGVFGSPFVIADGEPFWGGTYFPPSNRYGRHGFAEVLRAISSFYRENPDKITEQVGQMRKALGGLAEARSGGEIPIALNDSAADRLVKEFDMVEGGIGGAPKFPNPSILELLWRAHKRNGAADTRAAVLLSLDKMSQGGIYDHLGGGYARYSTDTLWLVPHFEKMLYDNAQMIQCLTWAWLDSGNRLYEKRVRETVAWVLREMVADLEGDVGLESRHVGEARQFRGLTRILEAA